MISLYGTTKGGNTIVRLDDDSLTTDETTAFDAYWISAPGDFGPAGTQGRMRRIVQAVSLGANSTILVTPIANDQPLPDQAEAFALVTTDGENQRVEACCAAVGTRFQQRVDVTTLGGALSFGEADHLIVPRRTVANS